MHHTKIQKSLALAEDKADVVAAVDVAVVAVAPAEVVVVTEAVELAAPAGVVQAAVKRCKPGTLRPFI